jgi:RNA polymerase sigma-70 factor, ECF subfamily
MTAGSAETHRSEMQLVSQALAGDEQAFRALTEPHRRALHVHTYRMLGSLHEAEEIVQETMLRAWRRLETFGGRASFGAWLYGIATNACLDALERRPPRLLPDACVPPGDPASLPAPPRTDVPWLEPYPDRLLELADESEPGPEARLDQRESIRLAFVAAIQHLPPRQRAVLILRDALGWSAREAAELLGGSVTSVNSALQRARESLDSVPTEETTGDEVEAALVERYLAAWEAADVAGLAALLKEDVELAMPPTPSWYRGREAVATFLDATFGRYPEGGLRLVATRANLTPAFAVYELDDSERRHRALAIKLLRIDGDAVAAITGFADASLFAAFGLPETL